MRRLSLLLIILAISLGLSAGSALAQEGKLKIKVTPKQGYVFVDGKAIRDGSQTISLSPGKHIVVVVNYGYKIATRDVTVEPGKTTDLDIALEPYGGTVTGPFGRIQINGAPRAAVLLNGKTPEYFVGHGDEFDNDFIWKQELLVPPGTHEITVTREGREVWSGKVTVAANQRVIIDVGRNGAEKTTSWPRGKKLGTRNLPRFKAGLASTTVAVAPVSGKFSAEPAKINCGETSKLDWSSAQTVHAEISGIGSVAASGEQPVSPHETTTYNFTASGPGGAANSSATVDVNTAVQANLDLNPAEVRYHRIGDKVLEQGSATLRWSTSNADAVTLDPVGTVSTSGSRTVQASPQQASNGPLNENVTYTLKASNVCGGSESRTATLHITGEIEPIPEVVLSSIYFPTDYPDRRHPSAGLLHSQQEELATLATGFKKYLEYDPEAKLSIEAHADVRGSSRHNQTLSERRAERIKVFLVEQGLPAEKIQTSAVGKEQQLDRKEVKELEEKNPTPPPKLRLRNLRADWLAYNRRVDVVLLPSGRKSTLYYPHSAADSRILWQVPKPRLETVEKNQ